MQEITTLTIATTKKDITATVTVTIISSEDR